MLFIAPTSIPTLPFVGGQPPSWLCSRQGGLVTVQKGWLAVLVEKSACAAKNPRIGSDGLRHDGYWSGAAPVFDWKSFRIAAFRPLDGGRTREH